MNFLSKLVYFIMVAIERYSIDESHGIGHSFNTLHHACDIFENEKHKHTEMIPHENVIYIASAIHDMCDKKYMNQEEGIFHIDKLIATELSNTERMAVREIVAKMSYSKVKLYGFPDLGKYQTAYNVVREADLLAAYDFDRAMIYYMYMNHHVYTNENIIEEAYTDCCELFLKRMLRHDIDGLFTFEYTRQKADILKYESLNQMKRWKRIIKTLK